MNRNTVNSVSEVFDSLRYETGHPYLSKKHDQMLEVTTGIEGLALYRGALTILAGRPSMGTSALATQIALHIAINSRLPTLYFTMKHTSYQLATRILSNMAKINTVKLMRDALDDADKARLATAEETIRMAPLYICDMSELSAKKIYRSVEEIHSIQCHENCESLGVVVIDDLQSMSPIYTPEAPDKVYGKVVSALRDVAHEFNTPVLVLSRLSNRLEMRKDKLPILSDLPSAAIATNADQILMLYRDEVYHPNVAGKGFCDLISYPIRVGPMERLKMKFVGEYLHYEIYR